MILETIKILKKNFINYKIINSVGQSTMLQVYTVDLKKVVINELKKKWLRVEKIDTITLIFKQWNKNLIFTFNTKPTHFIK